MKTTARTGIPSWLDLVLIFVINVVALHS